MRCVLDPGDVVIDCPPTFTMYAFDAAVNAARVVQVPRGKGKGVDKESSESESDGNEKEFGIDIQGIRDAVVTHKAKMLFLTSPNNPDGSCISDEELIQALEISRDCLVVLDEAYIEFAESESDNSGSRSRIDWVDRYDNLVVLRTFSKRAALAGLRVGNDE